MGMTLIKQIINLIRLQKSTDPHDKGIITRLSVNPKERTAVKEWHVSHNVTGTETKL